MKYDIETKNSLLLENMKALKHDIVEIELLMRFIDMKLEELGDNALILYCEHTGKTLEEIEEVLNTRENTATVISLIINTILH